MQLTEAISLIAPAFENISSAKQVADLGCGSGLFSQAMASLLPNGSTISCIDASYQQIAAPRGTGVMLEFILADFSEYDFPSGPYDGLLMANSLHYVSDKNALLRKFRKHLSIDAKLVIIEYDTRSANPWVPFPITFSDLRALCHQVGFDTVRKIGARQSIYGPHEMYACEITGKISGHS